MTLRQIAASLWIKLRYGRLVKHLYAEQDRVSVDFAYSHVSQLRSLRGLRLHHLGLYGTTVQQWSDLADLDFCELNVGGTSFDHLDCLQGKPLTKLEMYQTPVSSLRAIQGMPITCLQIGETRVRDFAPLARLPLATLLMLYCDVEDLSFLEGLNLSLFGFTFSHATKGVDCLKRMPNLKTIYSTEYDSFSPEEFWRRFDGHLPLDEKRTYYRNLDDPGQVSENF